MNIDEAREFVADYERQQEEKEEIRKRERAQAEKVAWGELRSVNVDAHHFWVTLQPQGWRVTQENTFTGEARGQVYGVTVDNVLVDCGGGYVLLEPYLILTNEEIDQLNSGTVPERLIRELRV